MIKKREKSDDPMVFVVSYDELYEKIKIAHVATGHGGSIKLNSMFIMLKHSIGRDKVFKHLEQWNISKRIIQVFVTACVTCNLKKTKSRKLVVRPILSQSYLSRAQVDLIDLQSVPVTVAVLTTEGEVKIVYKFVLNYQDHLTKFVCLRPLARKTADAVAKELLSIFCLIG